MSNKINIRIVDGFSPVGATSSAGHLNVIVVDGSSYVGRTHPSGAMNVIVNNTTDHLGAYHPSGAVYVTTTDNNNGALKVKEAEGYLSLSNELVDPSEPSLWLKDTSGAQAGIVTENYALGPHGIQDAHRIELDKTGGTFSRVSIVSPVYNVNDVVEASFWMKLTTNTSPCTIAVRIAGDAEELIPSEYWVRYVVTKNITVSSNLLQFLVWDNIPATTETADVLISNPILVKVS